MEEKELIHKSAQLCAEFVRIEKNVQSCQNKIKTPVISKKKFKQYYKIKHKLSGIRLFILTFIFSVFGVVLLSTFISMTISTPKALMSAPVSANASVSKAALIEFMPFWLFAIPIIACIISTIKFNHAYNDVIMEYGQSSSKAKEELKRIKPLYDQLYKKVHDKSQCIIPDAYIYVAEYIDKLIINHRADSLKEAINVYEQDVHNQLIRNELRNQTESINDQTRSVREELEWQAWKAQN